jgi:very-short-patch-repair endonuclease
MTDAERILWRILREALSEHHWRKQVPLGPFFADFVCHSAGLIIEIDGGQHASVVEYDRVRTLFLEAQGYRVLRFWNNEVVDNSAGVLERISKSLSEGNGLRAAC